MKHILSTTAVLALIAAPAFAQLQADAETGADVDAQVNADVDADADIDADIDADADVDADVNAGADAAAEAGAEAQGEGSIAAGMTLTSDALIGADIHDSNGEVVGTVADLIIDADGHLAQIIAEVGGFLGLGAREVALDRSQVDIEAEGEADIRITLAMTLEELEAMPEYEG